ncbi:cell division cycle protein 45 [Lycorma delicatula]|uniref:cell division cycle protein 45 n=1 Tax=Lycorma delicatula TaxID=130591 RepID=UPI003F512DEC
MFVKDIVREFYDVLLGQHVLLLVNYDIDAICSCKILQWLFQSEDVMYTLVPVLGVTDLITAFHDHLQDMKYVILVNCGGTVDLVDLIEPEEDVVIFVIDSHRPTDLCNIYSLSQIRLVALPGDDEQIPAFGDVFEGSEDEGEENEGEEGNESENADSGNSDEEYEGRQAKRLRLAEETIIKRRNKRQWEEKRNRIIFEYSQFTYLGRCSSVIIFELLWKVSKGNLDVLWWAIVGLTSYLILGDSAHDMYLEELQNLRKYVDELSNKKRSSILNGELITSQDEASNSRSGSFLSITPENDMNLAVYRHWTVEASLRHSMFTAVHLKLWTKRGEQRLQQLLAEMGLPLVQSRQLFSSMDIKLRHEFPDMMIKAAESYSLNNFVFSSFVLQYGFRGTHL